MLLGVTQIVSAQGVLLTDSDSVLPRHHHRWPAHRPVSTYRIKSIQIDSKIEGQVAVTQMSQTFVNTGQRQIQASFVFPLPYDGAVDRMTFLVDGKEYEAKLLQAHKARQIYEGYMRRNQDPALLEWMGQRMFKTSVFPIPAGAERTVQLRYTQLLRQDAGVNDYLIPMSTDRYTSQPIERFTLRTTISTRQKLKSVYSPTHSEIQVDRSGDNLAVVSLEKENYVPANDVRIFYSEDDQSVGANLLSHWPESDTHGYFTLLVTPEFRQSDTQPARKTVLFVIDRSGSMNGKKIEQAREAARFVLNNLRDGDLFNIITYASEVEAFEPELQAFDSQSRAAALGYIEGIFAGGSTNIDAALSRTFEMTTAEGGPAYVVFLSDGLPTKGETSELRIAANARTNNRHHARLISFGVGFDVNSRLLDRLTRENRGQSQYVRPDEDLEEHVSKLYTKISAPVLTDVTVRYRVPDTEDDIPVNRVYPAHELDLFAGQQLVLVGRYRKSGDAKLEITGTVGEESRAFQYEVRFAPQSDTSAYGFCARLWAARRIGEIIDVIDLEGKNPELIAELVDLSTAHGIVTPYTSYLADDLARPGALADRQQNLHLAEESLEALNQESGQYGFAQRGYKQQLKLGQALPAGDRRAGIDGLVPVPMSGRGGQLGIGGGRGDAIETDDAVKKETVRSVGKYTAYLRGNILFASNATDVDPEKDKDRIIELKRFSDKYFELIKTTTLEENQLLALQEPDEEMIVRLQGKLYWLK
jgi:Ca-activated chloride channel family protein